MRVIVAKKSGHIVDPAFFDAMAKAIKPTFVGSGFFDGEELTGNSYPNVEASKMVSSLKEVAEKLKDHAVIYFFDSDSLEGEDGQPYQVLENSDGDPVLACFAEGEFGDYKSPKEMVTEYLIDEITPVYKTAFEGDIAKTMEHLASERFAKKVGNVITDGTIVLYANCSHPPVIWSKGESRKTFDWGVVSRSCGYGEKGVVGKAADALGAALGISSKPAAAPAKTEEKKTDEPVEPRMNYKVPEHWNSKHKREASIIVYGTKIDNFKKGFEAAVTRAQFEELNKMAAEEAKRTDASGLNKGWVPISEWKPTEYKPFQASSVPTVKDTSAHNLPGALVTAEQIPQARNFLLKHVDRWKNELPHDPSELKEYEKRLPSILETTGQSEKVSPRLRYIAFNDWMNMWKENQQFTCGLAMALTVRAHALEQSLAAASKKLQTYEAEAKQRKAQ